MNVSSDPPLFESTSREVERASAQNEPELPPVSPELGLTTPIKMTVRRRRWIGAVILVLGSAAGLGYFYWSMQAPSPVYRLAHVTRGPVVAAIIASGTVNPVNTVQVGTQVSGQIQALYADYNSEVKEGQLIARINPDIFEAQVAEAEADLAVARAAVSTQQAALARAQADLETARSNLEVAQAQTAKTRAALADAERDYERKRRLAETGAVSDAVRDTALATRDQMRAQLEANIAQEIALAAAIRSAEAQIKTAEAGIQATQAQVLQKEAALRRARVNLEHTYIRAPVDGTVIQRNVDVGQTVAATLQAPVLFTIARDLRAMQVDTSVDEADVGAVREKQRVLFTVDAYPARTFEGEVVQIRKAPQVVQNVVTYDVVVSAPNPDLSLLPGMTANVRIITAERDNVLRLPNPALRYRPAQAGDARPTAPGENQVFTLDENGKPQAVMVKTGISDGTVTELVSGELREGDPVIVGEISTGGARPPSISPTMIMGPRL